MATFSQNIARNNKFHSDLRDLITENGGTIPADTPCEDLLPILKEMFGGGSSADTEYLKSMIERPTNAKIVIPQGATKIGNTAFLQFRTLRNVSIPNSVTSIGNNAFEECTSLIELTIPDSVTSIGEGAFQECTSLTKLTIPDSVTSIGDGAFQECTSLTKLTISNSVTSLGIYAFYRCNSLTDVTLENGFNCNNLDVSWSKKFSVKTLVAMLEALADRTGETAYTLTIGTTNLNKLTTEQRAIATNKNWNLA